MAWNKISLEDLRNRVVNDLATRLGITVPTIKDSLVYVFGVVTAGASYTMHLFVDWAQKQKFVTTCDDDQIERHGAELGVYRKAPTYATGLARFTGTNGTVIPQGTAIKESLSNLKYYTAEEFIIGTTITEIVVTAELYGIASNINTDSTYVLVSGIGGVDSEVITTALTNGADLESYDDWRARIHFRKTNPPQGGNKSDYIHWCTAVQPVTDCYPVSKYPLPNSVTCVVANYNVYPPVILDTTSIEEYVKTQAPVTAGVSVVSVAPLDVIINLSINTDDATIKQAIEDNITELFMLTEPVNEITKEQLQYTIQDVPYVFTSEITAMSVDGSLEETIKLGYFNVAVLDTINYTEV